MAAPATALSPGQDGNAPWDDAGNTPEAKPVVLPTLDPPTGLLELRFACKEHGVHRVERRYYSQGDDTRDVIEPCERCRFFDARKECHLLLDQLLDMPEDIEERLALKTRLAALLDYVDGMRGRRGSSKLGGPPWGQGATTNGNMGNTLTAAPVAAAPAPVLQEMAAALGRLLTPQPIPPLRSANQAPANPPPAEARQ